jgi:5-methylcytosine-specific restriction endonuclease McrA
MSKAYASHLGLAKRRGIISYLTLNDYKIIATKPCLYCGSISKRRDRVRSKYRRSYKINSVDRLDNERFYKIENSVSACFDCQEMKMDRTFLEFKNHILKIHDKLFRPDNGNHPV